MGIKSFFVILAISFLHFGCVQTLAPRPTQKSQVDQNVKTGDAPSVLENIEGGVQKPFRPKLALVLGPGLSNSFIHIGVLKKIKEAGIPVNSILGMGWGALAAYEYSTEGSLHGLEWKVSRSEDLKKLSDVNGFWTKGLEKKSFKDLDLILTKLLSEKGVEDSNAYFACPVIDAKSKAHLTKRKGMVFCMLAPPFFKAGFKYAPYFLSAEPARAFVKSRGAELFIYVDVLGPEIGDWGLPQNYITSEAYWFWVSEAKRLHQNAEDYDYTLKAWQNRIGILNFKSNLDLVRHGEQKGEELVEYLQKNYQF